MSDHQRYHKAKDAEHVMDKIIINGLQVHALIGVYDWERTKKQPLIVDVEMQLDLTKASVSDDVNDTVDYAAVASRLEDVANNSSYELLEALSRHMIDELLHAFPIASVALTMVKPGILPNAQKVAVQLYRER